MGNLVLTLPAGVSKEQLRREHYNATVTHVRNVHRNLAIIRVRPDFPLPEYQPGQFTSLGLGWWEDRVEGSGKDRLHEMSERLAELDQELSFLGDNSSEPSIPEDAPAGGEEDGQGAPSQERETLSKEYGRLVQKLIKRVYSICDPVLSEDGGFADLAGENTLEFYVTIIRNGEPSSACPLLTPRLALLREGDRLFVQEKISGNYILDGLSKQSDIIFAATGTGEAPHNAMIARLMKEGHRGQIVSVVSARYKNDLAYLDVHRRLEEAFAHYKYVTLTTRDLPLGEPKVYVQDFIKNGALEELLGKPLDPSMHFFLCGNPVMVGAPKRVKGETVYPEEVGVIEVLEQLDRGFLSDPKNPARNIHFEAYW